MNYKICAGKQTIMIAYCNKQHEISDNMTCVVTKKTTSKLKKGDCLRLKEEWTDWQGTKRKYKYRSISHIEKII